MLALSMLLAMPAGEEVRQLRLEAPVLGLEVFDADGDGLKELMVARDHGLEFRSLADPPGEVVHRVALGEARSLSWCLGQDAVGAEALYVLRDGVEVLRWDRESTALVPVHSDPKGSLPAGIYPFEFVRDLRGLGARDLAMVHRDGVQLAFATGEGFEAGPKVRHKIGVDWSLGWPKDLPISLEQSLEIPTFTVQDQNGDGHPDLIFEDDDAVHFFWTDGEGVLPTDPTFELDLQSLRDRLPQQEQGSFNPSNLMQALESQVVHTVRDLDGDGQDDLLLQMGPRVLVYAGTPTGFDRSGARQVLKSSGNLLWSFAADENQDGQLDLLMLRIDDVSLAQLLMWVVLGGSVKFDLFAYHQESDLQFARRPSSHRTLEVEFGPILSIEDDLEGPIDRLKELFVTVPVPGDYDGDGAVDDLALLGDGHRITFHQDVELELDQPFSDAAWRSVLDRFDRAADGERVLEIGLDELITWTPFTGRELFDLAEGEDVVYTVDFPEPPGWISPDDRRLYCLSIGPDATDDVMLVESGGRGKPVHVSLRIFTGK